MSKFLKRDWYVITLLVLAILTRFLFLSYPAEVVFDEVYYEQFASDYYTHQYYFCNHPPLGKLIIAGFAGLFGFNGGLDLKNIGQAVRGTEMFALRFAPALFGVLFVLLIYFLILKLGMSKKAAFLGGFLVLCDGAILTQSRLAVIDIFLLFFGFLAMYFLLCYRDPQNSFRRKYIFLGLVAVSVALAFAVKWTALSFFAILLVYLIYEFFRKSKKGILLKIAIITILPFLTYYFVFLIHFGLLYKTGSGDAFMRPEFLKTLSGNQIPDSVKPSSSWQKFTELNTIMYATHAGMVATHPYSSTWQQWPFNKRPIWYWNKNAGDMVGNINLLGNPVIWWSVLIVVAYTLVAVTFKDFRKKIPSVIYFLLFGYFLNLFAFIFIGRVVFIYHYFPSLIVGILIVAVLFDKFINNDEGRNILGLSQRDSRAIYFAFLFFVFAAFIILSPLVYGFMISSQTNEMYGNFINFLLN